MSERFLSRRRLLIGSGLSLANVPLSACGATNDEHPLSSIFDLSETLTMRVQRFMQGNALARQFAEKDLSANFRVNGTSKPDSEEYAALAEAGFSTWKLRIGGLVSRPSTFSLSDLKRLPARTQITRHDCVEGWSAIGQWTGVPLSALFGVVGVMPSARFVVFHCADELEKTFDGSGRYYESIDLIDAFHPQTILAYGMNGENLPIGHGAPIRLRVERQLGYKQAKYIMSIELVESFSQIAGGKGGYWEDRGYQWFAGI
jgi:DMSO/TMAO reductase YedYZ molybdopterin-dependent catalytic subunit